MPIPNQIIEAETSSLEKDPNEKEKNGAEVISIEKNFIDKELERVKEKFLKVIEFVDKNNEKLPEGQKELFKEHDNQILELVIERGRKEKLSESQMELLEVGAIMHDMYKSESFTPEWAKHINGFMMIYHGEMAALMVGSEEVKKKEVGKDEDKWEVDEELEKKRKQLRGILMEIFGEENFEENMEQLQAIFRTHMGPGKPVTNQEFYEGELPFMAESLEKAKEKLPKNMQFEHPVPAKDDILSSIMRAADMYSLSSPIGVRKMLGTRSLLKHMQDEDEKRIAKYEKFDISITKGEAALISALTTTRADRDMLPEEELRGWVQEAIDETMKVKKGNPEKEKLFFYGLNKDNPIETFDNPDKVWDKVKLYKKLVRQEKENDISEDKQRDAREKIDRAA